MTISPGHFSYLTGFLKKQSGLAIDDRKLYLIRTRLLPLARQHGFASLDLLVDEIRKNACGEVAAQVLDQMTTNETLFFRDSYPFEVLKKHLFPALMKSRRSSEKIKIWSAAASTGQEAFSIAMTAMHAMPQADLRVDIVGSDISAKAITYAKEATYKQMEIQRGLSIQKLEKYFKPSGEYAWQVNNQLRAMVHFMQANLIAPTLVSELRHYSLFDIVFCRNVLIYFDLEQRKQVIDHISRLTEIGGYMFTGAGEQVEGNRSIWKTVRLENRPVWQLVSRN